MADRLAWPPILDAFTAIMWQTENVSRSGGVSVLGSEQVMLAPAGRWKASLTLSVGAMSWNGSDELLAFRGFMARLRGRAGVVDLPYFDGRGPAQLAGQTDTVPFGDGSTFSDGALFEDDAAGVVLAAGAAMNATQITITYPAGVQPLPGQCIGLPGGWMHQIADLLAQAGNDWTVLISPWLRDDYAAGAPVEVDRPTSRMRLVSDTSGALTVQAGEAFANPTLEFVEAF